MKTLQFVEETEIVSITMNVNVTLNILEIIVNSVRAMEGVNYPGFHCFCLFLVLSYCYKCYIS
jgi:hypothetical protein